MESLSAFVTDVNKRNAVSYTHLTLSNKYAV